MQVIEAYELILILHKLSGQPFTQIPGQTFDR